jgi:N-acetylmuramic acid 6-phosphate (MurNAc-6-P) etherase
MSATFGVPFDVIRIIAGGDTAIRKGIGTTLQAWIDLKTYTK